MTLKTVWGAYLASQSVGIKSVSDIAILAEPIMADGSNYYSGNPEDEKIVDRYAIPPSGATVRVPAYDGMALGQIVEIILLTNNGIIFRTELRVTVVAHYMDFIVPKNVLTDEPEFDWGLGYIVSVDGIVLGTSYMIVFRCGPGLPGFPDTVPPVLIPQLPDGELSLGAIPDLGVRVEAHRESFGFIQCSAWRPDGTWVVRERTSVDGDVFYIDKSQFIDLRPGGEVRVGFDGANYQGLQVVLRVVE